ncbi:MAG: DegT/DnrJ/EryC1/StrS family aminotransferase [Alphaproteobacteria bacterium]|nr:DegT/DnrJ/EryC1/StrS family aminotransferase [Alphaproteobacteria bacterium]
MVLEQNVSVPFADLHKQYLSIKPEIDAAIADVIENSAFIRSKHVEKFEDAFARTIGAAHCVSCAHGTDALYIAMVSLGVKPGDEVIVPAMSWISTSETVTQAGGRVVFCDIDPVTYTLDPNCLDEKISSRTVGIIPVHLYGQPADMDPIMATAEKNGLWVLEDCAQAHLAQYKGRTVGTIGNAGTFSFYPGKNLGAMGDAGAIVTNDAALADHMAKFARHGGLRKGEHEIEGINSRMDGLQAAILSVKLRHLPDWTKRRREIAASYCERMADIPGLILPKVLPGRNHVWHLFVVRHEDRDALARKLKAEGVQTNINYPSALPFLAAYEYLGHFPEDFSNAFACQSSILSLPLFPEMSAAQIGRVAGAVEFSCGQPG